MIHQAIQTGILAPVPALARYLCFSLTSGADSRKALTRLKALVDGEGIVVGFGLSLVSTLTASPEKLPELKVFPESANAGIDIPSTPMALWCWLRGEDRGDLLHLGHQLEQALAPAFRLESVVDGFRYQTGRDLTGYEDGTENPQDDAAYDTAFVSGTPAGHQGSSFVAVQQWVHNWQAFGGMQPEHQDHAIGRRKSDNLELADAPASAHVKRTAQESFDPEAFVLRRSMPWADAQQSGLMFVAFGKSFEAFEAQLKRMVGQEDGIVDGLFQFTRPITGSYFWCPPLKEGRLDLSLLGL